MPLYKVGRDPQNYIVISDPHVSARHAEIIVRSNGDIYVEDKGSTHGTTVNGKPINPGTAVMIHRGDRVEFAGQPLNWSNVPMPKSTTNYKAIYGIGKHSFNQIPVSDPGASRFHATLKIGKNNKVYIEDENSTNGTFVNGRRITPGQEVQLHRKDEVRVGNQAIDLKPFFPKTFNWAIVGWAAAIAVVVTVGIFAALNLINNKDYSRATAYVEHHYHYVVTLPDDPYAAFMKEYSRNWPQEYEFGVDKDGNITPMGKTAEFLGVEPGKPIGVSGTAFFVSEDGRLLTNHHVARPWDPDYIDADEKKAVLDMMGVIQQLIVAARGYDIDWLHSMLGYSRLQAQDAKIKYLTAKPVISGETDFMGLGYAYDMIDDYKDLEGVRVLKCSDKADVAVMQLKKKNTPDPIKKHIINLNHTRANSKDLKPGHEKFRYFGYPAGKFLNLDNENNFGLTPQIYEIGLSRLPGKFEMELQGQVIGGASGSPIIDDNGYFVGIINKAIPGTTISRGVLAKHAIDLYNEVLKEEGN